MIAFLLFLSGNYFDFRILSEMREQNLISVHQKTKLFVLDMILKLFLVPFCQNRLEFLFLLLLSPSLFLKIYSEFTKKSRERDFEQEFLSFLSLLLLIMKSGKAFGPSFIQAVHDGKFKNQPRFLEIYNTLMYSDKHEFKPVSPAIYRILLDLNRAAKSSYNTTKFVTSLRDRWMAQKLMREKVQVLTQQARTQGGILTLLFTGIFIFSAMNFGFMNNLWIFVLSITFFAAGFIWLLQIGKHHTWQV